LLEVLARSDLVKKSPPVVLLTDADANKGNAIADTAAIEIIVLRIERVVGSVFIIFTSAC
jgi:hypothetical protein